MLLFQMNLQTLTWTIQAGRPVIASLSADGNLGAFDVLDELPALSSGGGEGAMDS